MELDIGAEAFINLGKQVEAMHGIMAEQNRCKPIHYTVAGTAQQGAAAGELDVFVDDMPPYGRIWNVLSIIANGIGLTPTQTQSYASTASVTSPAANATIAQTGILPPGLYNVSVTAWLEGTVSATDTNNLKITGGAPAPNPIPLIPAVSVPTTFNYTQTQSASGHITVAAVAAGTVGAIYNVSIVATPIAGSTTIGAIAADVFLGQNLLTPDLSSQILTSESFSVPGTYYFPRNTVWSHHGDTVFARVYNVPASVQVQLMARIAEYPVEAVEALSVR